MTRKIAHNAHGAALFPIPFLVDNLGESARELNRGLIADIDRERRADTEGAARSFVGAWQSRSGLDRKYRSFAQLRQQIELSARTYLRHIQLPDDTATGCSGLWANHVAGKGGHSGYHIHGSGRVVATGVYYPASLIENGRAPEQNLDDFDPGRIFKETGKGGELIVHDPNYAIKRQVIKPPGSPYYEGLKVVAPRESLLIVFPQYLPHSVAPLLDDGIERYSISYTVELI